MATGLTTLQDISNVNWILPGTSLVGGYTSPPVRMLQASALSITTISAGTVSGTWKLQETNFGVGVLYPQDAPPSTSWVDTTVSKAAATGSQTLTYSTAAKWVRLVFTDSGSSGATFQAAVTIKEVDLSIVVDASGNATILGTETLGAGTKLAAPSDGTLQITKSDGTFSTLLLGQAGATTGIQLVASNGNLAINNGAGSSTNVMVNTASAAGGVTANSGNGTNAGLQLGSSASAFRIDYTGTAAVYKARNGAGTDGAGFFIQGQYTVAKTANYTIVAADSGTHFVNTLAAGTVTFTLPTAVQGMTFKFSVIANQTVTVTGAGTVTAVGLTTGSNRSMATQFGSFEVVCYDGTNWVCRSVSGTLT